jgi:hypothetical protein
MVVRIQRDAGYLANRQRNRFGGLVIRGDHDSVVTGLEQHAHGDIDAFLGTRETEDVRRVALLVGRRDGFTQCGRAVGLRVTQVQGLEGLAIGGLRESEQLGEAHALGIGRREVVPRGEFPA